MPDLKVAASSECSMVTLTDSEPKSLLPMAVAAALARLFSVSAITAV